MKRKRCGFAAYESPHGMSKEWYTPRYIFEHLGVDFDLDPCSPGRDIVPWIPARTHYTVRDNGLEKEWFGTVFMNPPYGLDTPVWFARLVQHNNGIALAYARTDTRWFHESVYKASVLCFIRGRVRFIPGGTDKTTGISYAALYNSGRYVPKAGTPAGSMLVAFGDKCGHAVMKCGLGLALAVRQNANVQPW